MYEAEHYIVYIGRGGLFGGGGGGGKREDMLWWSVVKGWLRHYYKDSV